MKNWIVRFAALYVFNLAVLLLIGLLTPGVNVEHDGEIVEPSEQGR